MLTLTQLLSKSDPANEPLEEQTQPPQLHRRRLQFRHTLKARHERAQRQESQWLQVHQRQLHLLHHGQVGLLRTQAGKASGQGGVCF